MVTERITLDGSRGRERRRTVDAENDMARLATVKRVVRMQSLTLTLTESKEDRGSRQLSMCERYKDKQSGRRFHELDLLNLTTPRAHLPTTEDVSQPLHTR